MSWKLFLRSSCVPSLVFVLATLLFAERGVAADDLREQFGTSSLAAAKALNDGIHMVQSQKPAEALSSLEKAVTEDPNLQMAYYWKARALVDIGDVDQGMATYRKLVTVAERTKVTNITIDGCINAGLVLAKLKEEKESRIWLTRAVALDPSDKFKMHWKAYRNMAITHHLRGEHLSAAMCAFAAYAANPQRVGRKMVIDFINAIENEEVGQVLAFEDQPSKLIPRAGGNRLGEPEELQGIGKVSCILPDPAANRLVAFSAGESTYYVVDCGGQNSVKTVTIAAPILAASLVGGELYLSVRPASIMKVDVATGKTLREWELPGGAPGSLAALPAQDVVLFAVKGRLHSLDLDSGKTTATDFMAHAVVADPRQRFCYAFIRDEAAPTSGHVIIDGRPIFFHTSHVDWAQTALFKYAVLQKQPVLAELRLDACSNGHSLYVSPEGQWTAVVGGGGWRPLDKGGNAAGYGVAVLAAANLGHVQGFFATGAYPVAIAVNPVTAQVAAVRAQDAQVYHLGQAEKPAVLIGPHSTAAAWSPDGKYLYISSNGGVRAWRNTLTADEAKTASGWWRGLGPSNQRAREAVRATAIKEYLTFEVKHDRKETLAVIALAQAEKRTTRLPEWLEYEPYQADKDLSGRLQALADRPNPQEAGLRIYQLKKLQPARDSHPVVAFLLGMTYFFGGQLDAAAKEYVAAIRLDEARTSITLNALRGLGQIHKRNADHEGAAYCYAHVLRLDLATPRFLDEAKICFDAAKIGDPGDALLQQGRSVAMPAKSSSRGRVKLPRLPAATETAALSAEKIFARAVPCVVMVRAGASTGSGVCVADQGIILTNQHVVGDGTETVQVYAYRYVNGSLKRSRALDARVLYQSLDEDLAVLQVANPPDSLVPLALAPTPPREGAKVYAIGNPGLAAGVLEHSITDGIVSSAERSLNEKTFIQHTAAVNPGNSGGPLLDERCHIVGVITTKARLENVSFAIPARSVRNVFEAGGGKDEE